MQQDFNLLLRPPEHSDWECELFGCGRSMVLKPVKGQEPSWFWRQMQYLCFGNKWRKIYDTSKGS